MASESFVEETAKLIYDSFKGKKEVDDDFVEKLCYSIVSEKQLENQVKHITFTLNESIVGCDMTGVCAMYFVPTKTIYFNIPETNRTSLLASKTKGLFSDDSRLFSYFYALDLALHECEHASQDKIMEGKLGIPMPDDLETAILFESQLPDKLLSMREALEKTGRFLNPDTYNPLIERYEAQSNKFYIIKPAERLAMIRSWQDCINVSHGLDCSADVKKLLAWFEGSHYLLGYDAEYKFEPSVFFIAQTNPYFTLSDYDKLYSMAAPLSEKEKMLYGLAIPDKFLKEERQKVYSLYSTKK